MTQQPEFSPEEIVANEQAANNVGGFGSGGTYDATIAANSVPATTEPVFKVYSLSRTLYSSSQSTVMGIYRSLEAAQEAAQSDVETRSRARRTELRETPKLRWDANKNEAFAEVPSLDLNYDIESWDVL